jgi:integrase
MLDAMHRNALDRRDRAMLLLGFFAALNRSQLVAIDVSHIAFSADVMVVQLDGHAREVAIPITGGELCATTAVRKWIEHAALDVEGGPLFRRFDRAGDPTPHRLDSAYVSVVLKERLKAVGIEPDRYSAHSLRRGRLLEAAKGVL